MAPRHALHRAAPALTLAWAAVILALSLTPGQEMPEVRFWEFDKFAHIGVYTLLALFWTAWALRRRQYRPPEPRYLYGALAVGVPALFGVAIECVQGGWIPDRYFDVLDILANIIGSITGWIAYVVAFRIHSTDQTLHA